MQSVEPDLKLGGLSLWVFGRQYPHANDFWDGNWLNVRARVEADKATVEAQGAIVFAAALEGFAKQLETIYATLTGEAELSCLEPNLRIVIRAEPLGHLAVSVMITPDHLTQSRVQI